LARLLPLGFVLLALLAYAPALGGWFLSDDAMIGGIYPDGAHVDWDHVARTFQGDWRGFTGISTAYFRPLVVLTLALDVKLWGLRPFGFHLTNVVLHGLVAWLVAVVGRCLGASKPAAVLGAGAFALMPLHPESVAWISGRTDVVYAIPALASIAAFLELHRTGARSMLALSVLAYVLALLAKENAVAVPCIAFALFLSLPQRDVTRTARAWALLALVFFTVTTLLYLSWRTRVLGDMWSGRRADFYRAPEGNFTRITHDVLGNLELCLFPYNRQIGDQLALAVGAWLVVLALVAGALVSAFRRELPWRTLLTTLFAFVGSMVPVATMMQMQVNLTNTRMWYLPLAFFCLLVGNLLLGSFRRTGLALGIGLLGAWFALLRANLGPWVDAGELMRNTRSIYARTFGAYAGERIEGLPMVDRGAYVALYNAEAFGRPLVMSPPRFDQQARYDIGYDTARRRVYVYEAPAWRASERLEQDLATGVWLWHPDGAALERASLTNLKPLTLSPGSFAFESQNRDPSLVMVCDRDLAAPEDRRQPEYAYLLLRPEPPAPPEMFWIDAPGQQFTGERRVSLQPELVGGEGRIAHRQRGGFFVYAARLDTHPRWPGLHAIEAMRLDPTTAVGELVIGYFNVARRGAPSH
jgi:hypothetical protein